MAQLQHEIAQPERKRPVSKDAESLPGRHPLAPDQIALSHDHQRIALDDELRADIRYLAGYVDDQLVQRLRDAMAGRLGDGDLADLMGQRIERFRASGYVTAEVGSDEWRQIARALCAAEYEASARVSERGEGDFTGSPEHPVVLNAKDAEAEPDPVSLSKLWADYVKARTTAGFMKDGGKRLGPVATSLQQFL